MDGMKFNKFLLFDDQSGRSGLSFFQGGWVGDEGFGAGGLGWRTETWVSVSRVYTYMYIDTYTCTYITILL